jgi:hypothetical protein
MGEGAWRVGNETDEGVRSKKEEGRGEMYDV